MNDSASAAGQLKSIRLSRYLKLKIEVIIYDYELLIPSGGNADGSLSKGSRGNLPGHYLDFGSPDTRYA